MIDVTEPADTQNIGISHVRRLTLMAGPIAGLAIAAALMLVVAPMLGFSAWTGARTDDGQGALQLPAPTAGLRAGLPLPAFGRPSIPAIGTSATLGSLTFTPQQVARLGLTPQPGGLPSVFFPSPTAPTVPGLVPGPAGVTAPGVAPVPAVAAPADEPVSRTELETSSSSPVLAATTQADPISADRRTTQIADAPADAAALTASNALAAATLTASNAAEAAALTARNALAAATLTASNALAAATLTASNAAEAAAVTASNALAAATLTAKNAADAAALTAKNAADAARLG